MAALPVLWPLPSAGLCQPQGPRRALPCVNCKSTPSGQVLIFQKPVPGTQIKASAAGPWVWQRPRIGRHRISTCTSPAVLRLTCSMHQGRTCLMRCADQPGAAWLLQNFSVHVPSRALGLAKLAPYALPGPALRRHVLNSRVLPGWLGEAALGNQATCSG